MSLHADAVQTLTAWTASDPEQAALRQDFLQFLATNDDAVWRSCAPAHLTASSLIVDAAAERVLLVLHGKVGMWLQTGGHCEPGDTSLAAAALREATEESGIDGLELKGEPLRLHRHGAPCRPGIVDEHLDVKYLAIAPPSAVPQLSHESSDIGWFPVDALPEPTPPDVHEFVDVAVRSMRRPRSHPSLSI